MKTETQIKREQYYFLGLKELQHQVNTNLNLKVSEFLIRNKLSTSCSRILREAGILEYRKNRGKGGDWKWVGIDPTLEMAQKVLVELRKITELKRLEVTMYDEFINRNKPETPLTELKDDSLEFGELKLPIAEDENQEKMDKEADDWLNKVKRKKESEELRADGSVKLEIDHYELQLFFGLITLRIKPVFRIKLN